MMSADNLSISTQADRFAARLFSGQWTQSDEAALEQWLGQNPENVGAFERALQAWDSVEGLSSDDDIVAVLESYLDDRRPVHFHRRKSMMYAVAASFALVILVSALLIQPKSHNEELTLLRLTTQVGEQHSTTLPDGTVVALNTDSALIIDYSKQRRRAILDRGEVFFDVSENKDWPFTVEIDARSITVLGTRFNVRKLPGRELSVAVLDGIVAVHRKEDLISPSALSPKLTGRIAEQATDRYLIDAGMVVTLKESGSTLAEISQERSEDAGTWRKGYVRFDNAPLIDVIDEINRYTTHTVIAQDSQVAQLRVNAVLRLDQLDSVFEGLESTLPVKVEQQAGRIVIRAQADSAKGRHEN